MEAISNCYSSSITSNVFLREASPGPHLRRVCRVADGGVPRRGWAGQQRGDPCPNAGADVTSMTQAGVERVTSPALGTRSLAGSPVTSVPYLTAAPPPISHRPCWALPSRHPYTPFPLTVCPMVPPFSPFHPFLLSRHYSLRPHTPHSILSYNTLFCCIPCSSPLSLVIDH